MSAVTLDLWHTLMYLAPADEEAYMQHQLAFGREVLSAAPSKPGVPDHSEAELGAAFARAYEGAVARSAEGKTVTPAEQIAEAARETGREVDPARYLALLQEEVSRTRFRVAPGALELLRGLRERGYRVGIISNTVGEPGAFLRPILSEMGFDRYVQTYVFSDEHPWTKPSPEIFRYAASRLGEKPSNAVHVGDGWSDLEGARRAGYRGAVLFTGLQEYGESYRRLFLPSVPGALTAQHRADRLEDVGPLIEQILPVD